MQVYLLQLVLKKEIQMPLQSSKIMWLLVLIVNLSSVFHIRIQKLVFIIFQDYNKRNRKKQKNRLTPILKIDSHFHLKDAIIIYISEVLYTIFSQHLLYNIRDLQMILSVLLLNHLLQEVQKANYLQTELEFTFWGFTEIYLVPISLLAEFYYFNYQDCTHFIYFQK